MCTRNFVALGSTPRPGGRAASVTLGHHHKPFRSARTARYPRALDLVRRCGGLSAVGCTNRAVGWTGDRYTTAPGSV